MGRDIWSKDTPPYSYLSSLDNFLEEPWPFKQTHFHGYIQPSLLAFLMWCIGFSRLYISPVQESLTPPFLSVSCCSICSHRITEASHPPSSNHLLLLRAPKDILWNEALLLFPSCWAHVVLISSRSLQPKASQERAKGISQEQVQYSRSPVRFLERKRPWQEAWHIGMAKN